MSNLPFLIRIKSGAHPHLCRCQTLGCRRPCLNLGDGRTARHCWKHATLEERDAYQRYWIEDSLRRAA